MDYSLIDDLMLRMQSSYMNGWEEAELLWLIILRTIPMDFPEMETTEKQFFEVLSSGVIDVISLCGSYRTPCFELMDFLLNFDLGNGKKRGFKIEEPLFADNYTRTDPLGFYDHIIGNMEEFVLIEESNQQIHFLFNNIVTYFIKKIQSELKEFRPYFKALMDRRKEWLFDNNEINSVMTWITSLMYEVEYVIDSLLCKQYLRSVSAIWLAQVLHRLPDSSCKVRVDRIIGGILSMEVASKESIINYVVSTNRHQIIPIINYTGEDIGETLRQIFIDQKIVSTFDVCKWSLGGLPNSRRLVKLYGTQLQQVCCFGGGFHSKVVREYSVTLRPEEFRELSEELLAWWPKYFVIFENVTSELQFKLLEMLIKESSSNPASTILYTTEEAEVARKCRLNCPKLFYIPSKKNNTPDPTIGREVVGFINEKKEMLDRLIRGDVSRSVISISGMPGLGKTTLAKLLYKHRIVTQHFHIRAFCTVSKVYKSRELLLQLVCQLANDKRHGVEDMDLRATIYKSLKGRKYLIVLDDIWHIDAWEDLKKCFPDDKIGSRVIITTRQTELVPSNRQSVNLLSGDECFQLLKNELFQDRICPEELTPFGETIARNCKGLPLSVVLIAGFLKQLDRTKAAWQKISEILTSAIDHDAGSQKKDVMELSYTHLPDCLKPCFLYFGMFPEDEKIPAEKLICLWGAEGFLYQKVGDDRKNAEDVAANYLIDLASRSLVSIAEKDLSGRVKSYQVHDLIWEFCITKAHEEKFFVKLSGYRELSAYSNSLIESSYEIEEDLKPSGPRRLAINCERKQFVDTQLSSLPLVRSMLFRADKSDMFPNNTYDVSFIFDCFELLKILDLEEVTVEDSSLPLIFKLVLLKYLAVSSDVERIPGDLSMLSNLETLIFKSSKADKITQVPDSFWDMKKLRHVHISGNPDFDLDPKRVENTSTVVPKNLQTFSSPSLSVGGKLQKVLPRLQSIRKLKCRFSDQSLNVAENGQLFPDLDFLTNLESLKVVYNMQQNFEFTSGEFKFPEYLSKLSLSNFCMPWKEISQLTKLKALKVLKIQNSAFKGETWDMSEQNEVFENLKVLKLDALDIVNWCGVSEEHFPKLKHLLLWNLENLEEIPVGIGDINALAMIDVKWCSSSAEESAKRIKEEWEEFGNEIKISILSKARETGSSVEDELE